MQKLFFFLLLLISLLGWGQSKNTPTDAFTVSGQIKKEIKFSLPDLEKYQPRNIPDFVITNHSGKTHGEAKKLKGILIKDLLKEVEFQEENPRLLSEFYFAFIAADNYKVVYSWNEIFNSSTGDNVFLVTSKEGKQLKEMEDRILIVTPTDFRTGRRYVKNLSRIEVHRLN